VRTDEVIPVVATTISGSIRDWSKVERIVPLFAEHGVSGVELKSVDSHAEAREAARETVRAGARTLISAGGSGTFNAVLEGCCDSGVPIEEIRLGFLRKGSADLIGKVLGMPDEIEEAIAVFVESIRADLTLPCDLLEAACPGSDRPARHFVGYGGAGIFGRIPHFTENRLMKWYKGVLGQLFGDLGPFTTGMTLAVGEHLAGRPFKRPRRWRVKVDGESVAEEAYHSLVVVNGYLGPNMPWTRDPLGSGHFHLFALRDLGLLRFPGQLRAARCAKIGEDPERFGMDSFTPESSLELEPTDGGAFPLNVDGSTLNCIGGARILRGGCIRLLARRS
jgi:diacylglycerol kinase family enzyme